MRYAAKFVEWFSRAIAVAALLIAVKPGQALASVDSGSGIDSNVASEELGGVAVADIDVDGDEDEDIPAAE